MILLYTSKSSSHIWYLRHASLKGESYDTALMQRLQKQDPEWCRDQNGANKNNLPSINSLAQEDAYKFYKWVDQTFPGEPGVSETKLGLQVRGCLLYNLRIQTSLSCEFDVTLLVE